jgi:gliding motility-associated-like protein
MRRIGHISFATLLLLLTHLVALGQQDCFDAIRVCEASYTQSNAFSGFGDTQEIPNGSSCLGNGEANSVWYVFTVITGGELTFQLTPNVTTDDYDFAVYDISTDSCAGIANGTNQAVRCNYSAQTGTTGLSTGSALASAGSSDPNQCMPLSVVPGQVFALMVSNFTSSQAGYTLSFGGSASLVDQNAPGVLSIDQGSQCSPTQVFMEMDEPVACSTVQFGGGDFAVSGPQGVTILSATAVGCNAEGFSTTLRIVFTAAISTSGTYTIAVTNGVGGSTVEDFCGNAIPFGPLATFDVGSPGPVITTSGTNTQCGQSNGTATVNISNGTPPYNISWSTGSGQNLTTISNLGPGTYFVTVGDQNGCTANGSFAVQNTNAHSLSGINIVSATCYSSVDGAAQVQVSGGSGSFTYSWNTVPPQTTVQASNLPGGNVSVTVTDQNTGCVVTGTISIPRPAAITIPITVIPPGCGASDGEATAAATGGNGGFTYQWDTAPPQTSATATALSAGVYIVTVEDVLGCTGSRTVLVSDDNPPVVSIPSTTPDCLQGTGSATAMANTGTPPFTYTWGTVPPQVGATATSLSAGDYYVTVSDANGCSQITNVKIDSIAPPIISTDVVQPDCGQANGSILATVENGIGPISYSWTPSGGSGPSQVGLSEGSYTVTVVDSIGCTDAETILLEQLPPVSDFTFTNVCDGEEMTFEPTTTSGAVAWSWNFGDGNMSDQQNPALTYAAPGEYEVTVIFSGGCMNDTATHTVSVFAPPTAAFVVEPQIVTTRTDANFVYTGTGGTEFLWDLGGQLSTDQRPQYTFPEEGLYDITLMVTDANGCTDTVTQTIEVLLQPVIYLPNAFMPQGTPANSRFKGYGLGITAAELSIFDRWGTLLYYSDDINEILNAGWDGTYKGKPAPQDAYPYRLKASFYNNTSFEKLGTVTLVR